MGTRLFSLAGALVCAAVCATVASGAEPSRIVFAAQDPLAYGEIYRVTADGVRTDLSNSPAPDVDPAVAPDGKHVAFESVRGGHAALYLVGMDGRGLRRISPLLFPVAPNQSPVAELAWSPDGRTIAAVMGSTVTHLYLATLAGGWRALSNKVNIGQAGLAWSRDGRRLAYTTNFGLIEVVTSTGKKAWNVAGLPGGKWSATGELAVSANDRTIHVYDGHGHAMATFAGQAFAWSPSGDLLAIAEAARLQVRRVATGRSVGTFTPSQADIRAGRFGSTIEWAGPGRVRIAEGDGYVGFDVAHKRPWKLTGPAASWGSVIADNTVVVARRTTTAFDSPVALERSPLDGGVAGVLQTAASCSDELPFDALQLTANGRDVVYQSGCGNPSPDLFSVGPDGSGLRRLAQTPADERQPSLSPDGNSVVYVERLFAEKCNGCPDSIWTVPAAGGAPVQLTAPTFDSATPFDEGPSWSPDGKQILLERSGLDGTKSTLVTIAPTGGAAKDLGVIGRAPVWGPKLVAFIDAVNPKATIKSLDPATGAVRTVATAGSHDVSSLAWSADGRLAFLDFDPTGHASIVVVGSSTRPVRLAGLLPPSSLVGGLAWSPDGARFAFSATDANGVGEIYTIRADGTGLARVTNDAGAVGGISWR